MIRIATFLLCLLPLSALAQTFYTLPDGSRLQAYLAIPDTGADSYPLAVVMGGGPGNGRIASSTFDSLGQDFVAHGWAVLTPVSPNGQSFFGANGELVHQLAELIKADNRIDDTPALLAGISNGGISSLEIANTHPHDYLAVVAVPALANSSSATNLEGFPIYLRIGSEDQLGWAARYESTVRALNNAGAIVDAELVQGGGHRVPVDWENLDAWLNALIYEGR